MNPFVRPFHYVIAVLVICFAWPALGEDTADKPEPKEKTLAVAVTATTQNDITSAIDIKDLEHFLASELQARRFAVDSLSSVEPYMESDDGVYVIDVGIERADIAKRPRWSWMDRRFEDDEILHLELSLTVTRLADSQTLGSFNYSQDYRAEDFGRFSAPRAVRAAVYRAAAGLSSAFAEKARQDEFSADLEAFERPGTPMLDTWRGLSPEGKVIAAVVAAVLMILFFALAYQMFAGLFGRVFGRALPAPEPVRITMCNCNNRDSSRRAAKPEQKPQEAPDEESEAADEEQDEAAEVDDDFYKGKIA